MTKELRKAISHRSKLNSKHNKYETYGSCNKYKQQRNKGANILRRTKLHYYKYLDTRDLADNTNSGK